MSNTPSIDRRTFVKAAAAVGIGTAIAGCASKSPTHQAQATSQPMPPPLEVKRRFAIVGVGHRSSMYRESITKTYKDYATLVGVCDKNAGRVALAQKLCAEAGAASPPGYGPEQFEKMLQENKPEAVIVTTMCSTHSEYIVRALDAGFDVITEKPLTTHADKCQKIIDARKRTGRKIRVTFNYRYSPPRTQVKDILMSGAIGDILSVDFHWLLDTNHGADYFRRWHKHKENSGGLMVHKATHHFDLVNWWLGAVPVEVMAMGKREYYTPAMARRMGLSGAHDRCLTCTEKSACTFYLDLYNNAYFRDLYLGNEAYDGYHRDQCVFSPDTNIEDTMNVVVKYDTGPTMSYSLNAFNAWEGYIVVFNGTKGRLEHTMVENIYVKDKNGGPPHGGGGGTTIRLVPLRGPAKDFTVWTGAGGHGGGDKVMLDELFLPAPPKDKYLRAADERAGAASCLVGIAANRCFQTNVPVKTAELVSGLDRPTYAPMPGHDMKVPMPGMT